MKHPAAEPRKARQAVISERDQLWASLRALRPEIERLGAGDWEASERQKQIVTLLARIVAAWEAAGMTAVESRVMSLGGGLVMSGVKR